MICFQEQSLEVTALGQGLKFETDEPHFITLGGGRLSVGVTMCPVKLGMKNYITRVCFFLMLFQSCKQKRK